jgi:addiction module RelE/StbE family toxin
LARLQLTETAKRGLSALSRQAQADILDRLDLIAVEPRRYGYPLQGRLRGQWASRVRGNYRIVYRIDGRNDERVIVRLIRHRSRAYL